MNMYQVKKGNFYIAEITACGPKGKMTRVAVIKCTQIDDYKDCAYKTIHFKTNSGEKLVEIDRTKTTDQSGRNRNDGVKLLYRVTDKNLMDTSIIFLSVNSYLKKVTDKTYKEFYYYNPDQIKLLDDYLGYSL